jgi:phosphoglycolate phosphatase
MLYHCVLFDLDGTLLDTLADLAAAVNTMLAERGLPTHPVDAYRLMVGEGVETLVTRALPEDRRDSDSLAAGVKRMRQLYAEGWGDQTRPYPGIPELVAELGLRGVPRVVLSNKPDDFTRLMVAHYFPGHPFALVRGALPGTPKKPDPTAAREIAAHIGLDPGYFLYLGDSATDMRTAVSAGMFPVGAAWGFRDREEMLAAGARVIIDHPSELVGLLGGEATA